MRLTIVPIDGSVSVDGVWFGGIDLSFMAPSIHAVQWYETHGEIEVKDPVTGRMVANEAITSIEAFAPAIVLWEEAKIAHEQEMAALVAWAASNQPATTGTQSL